MWIQKASHKEENYSPKEMKIHVKPRQEESGNTLKGKQTKQDQAETLRNTRQ